MVIPLTIKNRLAATFGGIFLSRGMGSSSARSETIDIPDTGDGVAILKALARAFEPAHPGNNINIPESTGSSVGIKSVCNDKNLRPGSP